MTRKIIQSENKINSSRLFCNLHLLVCVMWHPRETWWLTIWQVWHLQINLWGLWESTDVLFPDKLWWKPRRHNWSSPTAYLGVRAGICFLCQFPSCHIVSFVMLTFRLPDWSESMWTLSVQAAITAENKVLIACLLSRPCFTRWLLRRYNRRALITVPAIFHSIASSWIRCSSVHVSFQVLNIWKRNHPFCTCISGPIISLKSNETQRSMWSLVGYQIYNNFHTE